MACLTPSLGPYEWAMMLQTQSQVFLELGSGQNGGRGQKRWKEGKVERHVWSHFFIIQENQWEGSKGNMWEPKQEERKSARAQPSLLLRAGTLKPHLGITPSYMVAAGPWTLCLSFFNCRRVVSNSTYFWQLWMKGISICKVLRTKCYVST